MAVHGIIDIGTNSVKMHVARVNAGGVEVLADQTAVTQLGEGLHATGRLRPEAIERTAAQVAQFAARARELETASLGAVGTMALRTAGNAADFVAAVEAVCGVKVEIIDGEEEARLSFLAVRSGLAAAPAEVTVFDTGGGSTEFVQGAGENIVDRFSLDVGSREPTERFAKSDPVTEPELRDMLAYLDEALARVQPRGGAVVGMGGTVTSLAAVAARMEVYDPEAIQGSRLTLEEVQRQVEMFRGLTIARRREVPGLMPKRADVILAGAAIVQTVLQRLEADHLVVSDRGLRHGIFHDRFVTGGSTP